MFVHVRILKISFRVFFIFAGLQKEQRKACILPSDRYVLSSVLLFLVIGKKSENAWFRFYAKRIDWLIYGCVFISFRLICLRKRGNLLLFSFRNDVNENFIKKQ